MVRRFVKQVACLLVAAPTVAVAQVVPATQPAWVTTAHIELTATALTQLAAQDTAGRPLGRVTDLMINPQTHEVEWLVLALPTSAAAPRTMIAVRWVNVHLETAPATMLQVDQQAARSAEPFNRGNWPVLAPAGAGWLRRWSVLSGTDVRTADRLNAGALEDVKIDPTTGKITTAMLCVSGVFAADQRLHAVPAAAITCTPEQAMVRVEMSSTQLMTEPTFAKQPRAAAVEVATDGGFVR